MKTIVAIISILGILGIPTAIWNRYYRESPNVQYSITTAIPLEFTDPRNESKDNQTSNEFVQLIDIENSGNGESKKIVVKISKAITQYHLSKHAENEQINIVSNSSGFEIDYPELPPATGFQITLKTNGAPITESQVKVSDQTGIAKLISAGSNSQMSSIWLILWMLIPLFYVGMVIVSFQDQQRYRFLYKRYSTDINEIIKLKKPWFVPELDWPEIIFDLLERALSKPIWHWQNVSQTNAFKILECERYSGSTI